MGATLIEPGCPPPPVPAPSPLVPPGLLGELHRTSARKIPPLHIARFRNVRYFQPSFAVIDERDRLLHAFSQGWEEGARGNNYAFEQVRLRRPLRLPGRSLLLDVKTHSENYFHWLIEAVPRFRLARLAGWNTADFDHILVSNPTRSFHAETFARFGVTPGQIVNTALHRHVECEELIAFTDPAMFTYDAALTSIHEAFPVAAPAPQAARLFITRNDAPARRIRNEDELFHLLEPLGFTRVSLTGRRMGEQAEIFRSAEIIVAAHGAAFANLVYCVPGTTVVEIHYPHYTLGLYWRMAQKLGLRYAGVQGLALPEERGKDPQYADMTIDAEACAALVHRALETRNTQS